MSALYVRNPETGEFEPVPALVGPAGVSPVVKIEKINNGHRVIITDKNGTQYFDVMDGGASGGGTNGVTFYPNVDASGNLSWRNDGGLTNPDTVNIKGPKGDDGVSVSKVEQTTTSSTDGGDNVITVTLSNGQKTTFTVKNGSKGSSGRGVSSMVYNSSTNKWTVTYTDNTTATVDGPVIPDVSGYMSKSGGTFTGAVHAKSATTADAQLRNTALVSADTDPTVNGQINWTYA